MKTFHLSIIVIMVLSGIALAPAFADESQWHVQHVTGKFLYSNPTKPDQVFNFQYRVLNGTLVELTKDQYGQFEAKVQSTDHGMLELRIPRNYPYTNMGYPYYNNTGNVAGTDTVIDENGVAIDSKKYSFVATDCFFAYSIPFSGKPIITLGFIVYPESIAYRGDPVPDHCIPETTFIDSPLKQFKSGVSVNDVKCKEGRVLVIHAHKNFPACVRPETASKLILRGWLYSVNEQVLSKQSSNSNAANDLYLKLGPDTLGSVPHRLVFFMASDSTAKIYVQYTSDEPNTGTMKSWATVYVGKANYTPLNSSKVTITADPPSIPLAQGSNTTVVYTITANKDATGIYWISLAQICGVMPVVMDMESSHLGPSDIPIGPMYCPAQFLNAKILGIYGGIAEYKIAKPIP